MVETIAQPVHLVSTLIGGQDGLSLLLRRNF